VKERAATRLIPSTRSEMSEEEKEGERKEKECSGLMANPSFEMIRKVEITKKEKGEESMVRSHFLAEKGKRKGGGKKKGGSTERMLAGKKKKKGGPGGE